PASIMTGTTARAVRSSVRTLMAKSDSQVASSVSWTALPMANPPAMLQSTSIRPKRASAAATMASTAAWSTRSAGTSSRRSDSAPWAASSPSRDTSTSTRLAPRAPKACATALPRLPAAPVTTTVRPVKSIVPSMDPVSPPAAPACAAVAPAIGGKVSGAAREPGLDELGGMDHRARLGLGLGPLVLGNRVVDHARGGLHIEHAVAHDAGADRDGEVHGARVAQVPAGAAVDATLGDLELVDDLHRAHLRRPRERAGREARAQHVDRVQPRLEDALDIADDVLHMGVLLDRHLVGDAHRARHGDAADVVAREV